MRPRDRLRCRRRHRLRRHPPRRHHRFGRRFFLDLLNFDSLVADADLVITGEGRLDHQTLHGKLPAAVALRAAPTPVIAVVGRNDLDDDTPTQSSPMFSRSPISTEEDTSRDPRRTAELLQHIGTQIGVRYSAVPESLPATGHL